MPSVVSRIDLQLRNGTLVAGLCLPVAALAFAAHAPSAFAFVAALIAAVLVVVTATDLERRIIPNKVVLPAAAIVLCAQITISPARAGHWVVFSCAAAALFLVPNVINRSLVGMGDAKLALLLGAGLGVGVVTALVIAFAAVFPVAVFTLIRGGWQARRSSLPFGPFLAFGALVVLIAPLFTGS
jgi:prepilin signal peptidase PulO-like enzyme (type II secretory pathway)